MGVEANYFRRGELKYLEYWQYFVRLVLRVLVLRVLRVLRVLGVVPQYFQCAQYTGSMKYISTIYICAPPFRQFHAHFIADSIDYSRMVPRMGVEANYFRGGGHEYVAYWQYLESICCEHSKYLRVQHS